MSPSAVRLPGAQALDLAKVEIASLIRDLKK